MSSRPPRAPRSTARDALLALGLGLAGPSHTQEPPRPADLGPCEAGLWTLTSQTFGADGSARTTPATSAVTCLFDGRVEMAEYRDLGPDGSVRFRGVSFHAWEADRSERTTLWLMLGDPGHTLLVERMEDGVLQAEGQGQDAGGSFLERSRTTFDERGGYRFVMDRSYDDGDTWRAPFNVLLAERVATPVPAAPALQPGTESARLRAGAPGGGIPVLDGLAEVRATTEDVGGRPVSTIRFSARYGRPDRWRTTVWRAGSLEVAHEEHPLADGAR